MMERVHNTAIPSAFFFNFIKIDLMTMLVFQAVLPQMLTRSIKSLNKVEGNGNGLLRNIILSLAWSNFRKYIHFFQNSWCHCCDSNWVRPG